jgi:hypothetical protein
MNHAQSLLTRRDRIEESVLLSAMALGCLAIWLAVPALTLWALSRFIGSGSGYLLLSLALVPAAMVGFGWLLSLFNRRYLVVSGALRRLEEEGGLDDGEPRRLYGPLESMLPASMLLAFIAFAIWILVQLHVVGPK